MRHLTEYTDAEKIAMFDKLHKDCCGYLKEYVFNTASSTALIEEVLSSVLDIEHENWNKIVGIKD